MNTAIIKSTQTAIPTDSIIEDALTAEAYYYKRLALLGEQVEDELHRRLTDFHTFKDVPVVSKKQMHTAALWQIERLEALCATYKEKFNFMNQTKTLQ